MRTPPTIDGGMTAQEFPKHWIPKAEALRLIDRSDHTLAVWTRSGLVHRRTRAGIHVWEASELLRAKETKRQNYLNKPRRAGLGRGNRHPATDEVRQMIAEGHRNVDIIRAVGCGNHIVGKIRKEMRDAMRKPPRILASDDPAPYFPERWITLHEAVRISGRSSSTIYSWHRKKLIRRKRRDGKSVYEASELLLALTTSTDRRKAAQFQIGRIGPAGPGRGHKGPMNKQVRHPE